VGGKERGRGGVGGEKKLRGREKRLASRHQRSN